MEGDLALIQKGVLDHKFVYILSQFQVKGFHSAVPVIGEGTLSGHTSLQGIQLFLCDFRAGQQPPQRVGGKTKKSEHTEACRGEYRNEKRVWGPGWNFQCLSHTCLSYSFVYSWKPYNFWWSPLLPTFCLPKCHSHSYLATVTSLWFVTASWAIIENMSLFIDFFKIPVT